MDTTSIVHRAYINKSTWLAFKLASGGSFRRSLELGMRLYMRESFAQPGTAMLPRLPAEDRTHRINIEVSATVRDAFAAAAASLGHTMGAATIFAMLLACEDREWLIVTPAEINILRAMAEGKETAATPGNRALGRLYSMGLIKGSSNGTSRGHYDWFEVTDTGRSLLAEARTMVKLNRNQRRYRAYLAAREAAHELTFRDFLTKPEFKEQRNA